MRLDILYTIDFNCFNFNLSPEPGFRGIPGLGTERKKHAHLASEEWPRADKSRAPFADRSRVPKSNMLRVPYFGVLIKGSYYLGYYIRGPYFWKLPYGDV